MISSLQDNAESSGVEWQKLLLTVWIEKKQGNLWGNRKATGMFAQSASDECSNGAELFRAVAI